MSGKLAYNSRVTLPNPPLARGGLGRVVLFKRFLKEPTVRMQTFTQKIHTEIANPNHNKAGGG